MYCLSKDHFNIFFNGFERMFLMVSVWEDVLLCSQAKFNKCAVFLPRWLLGVYIFCNCCMFMKAVQAQFEFWTTEFERVRDRSRGYPKVLESREEYETRLADAGKGLEVDSQRTGRGARPQTP